MYFRCLALVLSCVVALVSLTLAQPPALEKAPPKVDASLGELPPPTLLSPDTRPIDLPSALQLAGVQNPEILLARERITEAVALRQLAAAQFLPTLNLGTNVDNHRGTLQTSSGAIIDVNRGSLYLGLGAGAVGAGTVTIPGLVWQGNVSATIFQGLVSRQVVRQREFDNLAIRNQVLLRVSQSYLDLLLAAGRRAAALKTRSEAAEVARITANYAKTGQGRQADADRAATELDQRSMEVVSAENDLLVASARLCELLGLDPALRLYPADDTVAPSALVPEPIPLPELIAIALVQRPELGERQAAIRAAFLELRNAKLLPFSPNLIIGYSAGDFGGGSDLVQQGIRQADGTLLQQSRFGNYAGRQDFDAVMYWSLRNLGVGNVGLIRLAQSNLRQNELRNLEVLDRIRAEVATAYAKTHARFAQIEINEKAVATSKKAFEQDVIRTRNREGLPIEVLDSLRLLGRSRYAYLDAIVAYNRAHFELYVALGQPPADILARKERGPRGEE